MSALLISPHDDDSVLFASFTCIREKPVVLIVTDSYIQPKRGEIGCDAGIRASETEYAHEILGCPVMRLGIPDDVVTEEEVYNELCWISNFDAVYAPALQGGTHTMTSSVGRVAQDLGQGATFIPHTAVQSSILQVGLK